MENSAQSRLITELFGTSFEKFVRRFPVELVPVDSLLPLDESPRQTGVNKQHAGLLAEMDGPLPPILVTRKDYRVIDGMHRVHAAMLRGVPKIEARLIDCDPEELYLLSVVSNIKHGLPLSLADRKRAALRVIQTWGEWSDRAIAVRVGLSHKTVGALRRKIGEDAKAVTRIGRDGRTRPLTTAHGRRAAADLLRENPQESLSEVARQSGISQSTARDVRRRLGNSEDPVPFRPIGATIPGQRSASCHRPNVGKATTDPANPWWRHIQELRSDPSLRATEAGRAFLRAVDPHLRNEVDWDKIADNLPPHWLDTITELARLCAENWQRLVRQLAARREPRKATSPTPPPAHPGD
jgi:hypothetical protein